MDFLTRVNEACAELMSLELSQFDVSTLTALTEARFHTYDVTKMWNKIHKADRQHSHIAIMVRDAFGYLDLPLVSITVARGNRGATQEISGFMLSVNQVLSLLSRASGETGNFASAVGLAYTDALLAAALDHAKKHVALEAAVTAAKPIWAKNQANALRVTALVRMLVNDGKLDMSEKTLAENFKNGIKYDVDWARDMYERYGKKYDGKQNATAFIDQCLSEEFTATLAPRIELVAEHQTKYQPLKLRPANQAP